MAEFLDANGLNTYHEGVKNLVDAAKGNYPLAAADSSKPEGGEAYITNIAEVRQTNQILSVSGFNFTESTGTPPGKAFTSPFIINQDILIVRFSFTKSMSQSSSSFSDGEVVNIVGGITFELYTSTGKRIIVKHGDYFNNSFIFRSGCSTGLDIGCFSSSIDTSRIIGEEIVGYYYNIEGLITSSIKSSLPSSFKSGWLRLITVGSAGIN